MTITAAHPEPAGDGSVRVGAIGPTIEIVLPQHAIGAEGSDTLEWRSQTTSDVDEVETRYVAQALRAMVRHDFADTSWRVRASLANESDEPVSISRVIVAVHPGDGQAWVWAAGTAGLVVLVARDGGLWGFSLRRGSLREEAGDVVWLDAGTSLLPGRRVVFELVGRRCKDWDEISSMLPNWLPPLAVRGDEPVDLALPDAGVVAADCSIIEGPEGTEIRGTGLQQVAVHGAFGQVHLVLAFAPTLTDAVTAAARQVARLVREVPGAVHQTDGIGPQRRARGLDRTARRLIVLQSARSDKAADVVRGWLVNGVTDLLHGGGTPGPFTLAALAGEVQRREDPLALRTLLDALPHVEAESGAVLALTRVGAVLWGLGHDPEPVRQALASVLSQPGHSRLERIERTLVTGQRDAVAELLAALGGGLPGSAMPVPECWVAAYAVALTSLIADEDPDGPRLVHAAEIAARRLTAGDPNDPDVLAWLLLGER
jgi:hypothetical protein